MDAIETIEKDGFTLEIFQDDCPDSPMNWGWPVQLLETRFPLEQEDGREVISSHGNIWFEQISTQGRGCCYVTASKADWIKAMKQGKEKAEYHGWNATKKGMAAMVKSMAEIMYQYFEGDIYGYTVSLSGEEKDSCWGFYGMDHVMEEGRRAMESAIETEKEAQAFEKGAMAT